MKVSTVHRTVLYAVSGGFLTVAFGLLGSTAAQAKPIPMDADGVAVPAKVVPAANSASAPQSKAQPAPSANKARDAERAANAKQVQADGDGGRAQASRNKMNVDADGDRVDTNTKAKWEKRPAEKAAVEVTEKAKEKKARDTAQADRAQQVRADGDGGRAQAGRDKMNVDADGDRVGPTTKAKWDKRAEDKKAEETVRLAPIRKERSDAAADRAQQVRADGDGGRAQAARNKMDVDADGDQVGPATKAKWDRRAADKAATESKTLGQTLTEAEDAFEADLKATRDSAEAEINAEKDDPVKDTDLLTGAKRLAAGAYKSLYDTVYTVGGAYDTLNDAAQGDEEASRKVEQTTQAVVDGTGQLASDVWNDPKGSLDKVVENGKQAVENFEKAPVSGAGGLLVDLVGMGKAAKTAKEGVEAAVGAAKAKLPRVETPEPGVPNTRVSPTAATQIPPTTTASLAPRAIPEPRTGAPLPETAKPRPAGSSTASNIAGNNGVAARVGSTTQKVKAAVYEPVRNRVKLRAQTKRDVIEMAKRAPNCEDFVCRATDAIIPAQRNADGTAVRIDPKTGRKSANGMTVPEPGSFNFGHLPGYEWWRYKIEAERGKYTRQKVKADQNDPARYRLETPAANQSHQFEKP